MSTTSLPKIFELGAAVEHIRPDMERFIRIARQGKHPGSSTGEQSAYKLAKQIKGVSALMQDLDGGLKTAFLHYLNYAQWPDTREMMLEALPK